MKDDIAVNGEAKKLVKTYKLLQEETKEVKKSTKDGKSNKKKIESSQ